MFKGYPVPFIAMSFQTTFSFQLCKGLSWSAVRKEVCEHGELWPPYERQVPDVPFGYGPLPMPITCVCVCGPMLNMGKGHKAQINMQKMKEESKMERNGTAREFTARGGC